MECLAFKATTHRSTSRLMAEVDRIGSHIMASASREQVNVEAGVPLGFAVHLHV